MTIRPVEMERPSDARVVSRAGSFGSITADVGASKRIEEPGGQIDREIDNRAVDRDLGGLAQQIDSQALRVMSWPSYTVNELDSSSPAESTATWYVP